MNKDRVIDSLGRIDNDMIRQVEDLRTKALRPDSLSQRIRRHPLWRKWTTLAACLALVMSVTITVEAATGAVSKLLAPLFGQDTSDDSIAIIDQIGVPVGTSVSADGYTLTVDAIIGDSHHVAIVYTLTTDDETPITSPTCIMFDSFRSNIIDDGGGFGIHPVISEEAENKVHFVQTCNSDKSILGKKVSITFGDLSIYEDGEYTLIAEGPWELQYILTYEDSSILVPIKNVELKDYQNVSFRVNEILLSPLGLHIKAEVPGRTDAYLPDFHATLRLTDGTILWLNGGSGANNNGRGGTTEAFFSALFETPIPLEDIDAVIICGETFPVDTSQ